MALTVAASMAAHVGVAHMPSNATLIDQPSHKPAVDEKSRPAKHAGHTWWGSSHRSRNTHPGKRGKSGRNPHGRDGGPGLYMRLASYSIPMFNRTAGSPRPKRVKRAGAINLARMTKYGHPPFEGVDGPTEAAK